MDGLSVAFLGLIALGSVVQTALLVGLVLSGRRLSLKIAEIEGRLDRDLRPVIESASRVARNLAEISDRATLQARRIDSALSGAMDTLDDLSGAARRMLVRPKGPLGQIAALLKGLRQGLDVYHRLKGLERHDRRPARRLRSRAEEDEHLFI
jgi:hypothetical protein